MGTLVEKINYLKETKTAIKNAIVAKGVSVSDTDTFRSYAGKIGSINVGSPSQEKSINITENGSVAVTPDSGYLLSKVNVNVNVASEGGENKNNTFIDFSRFFSGAYLYRLISSIDLSSFDTSNATNMENMFNNLSNLTSLDLSSFNTGKVTNMQYMFYNCRSLKSLDLKSFNTSNVTNMYSMFNGCSSLKSLGLSSFNTINVTTMKYMFYYCSSLQSLDLIKFNTSKVTNMENMFTDCSSLTSLDLSSFDTSNVTSMYGMFTNCSSLTSLDLSSFNTSKVTSMTNIFFTCGRLSTLILGNNWASYAGISSFDLNYCNSLSHDSLVDIMNKLATRTNSPTIRLTMASKALLTDSEKAIATGKGWTIA